MSPRPVSFLVSCVLLGAFLVSSARATVSFEFQLGSVPLPPNSVGILVVDVDGDGFVPPANSQGTVIAEGSVMGGRDDVVIAVFPITSGNPFSPESGFAEFVGPIDYRALGLEEGQDLIFYAFPGRSLGDPIRRGESFVSFRTDDPGSLVGDMGFSLPPDGGAYVLGALGAGFGGTTDLSGVIPEEPMVTVDDPVDLIVGGSVDFFLEATGNPTRYIVRGLPPGLSYDRNTGRVSGRPRRAGNFRMRVWVQNEVGRSGPLEVAMNVESFPEEFLGTFEALVGRNALLNDALGGKLVIRTAPSGRMSGRLFLGNRSYGFREDFVVFKAGGQLLNPTTSLTLNRRGEDPLQVALFFSVADGSFHGDVNDGVVAALFSGDRQTWHARRNRPEGFEGNYVTVMDLDPSQGLEGDPDVPQGNGFASLRVLRSGVARWAGRLPDGSPASSAGILGPDGEYCVWRKLYRNTGSLLGTGTVISDPGGDGNFDDNLVDGDWDWVKQPQASPRQRNYRDGFGTADPVRQLVSGERYFPPSRGEIPLGFPDADGNAQLSFTEGGLSEAEMNPDVLFRLTARAAGAMPKPGDLDNPARTRFFLSPRTGLMRGNFLLLDENPESSRPWRRGAAFQGMVLPSQGMGAGYFLLGQLPDALAEPPITIRSAPILSGQVILEGTEP